MDSELEFMPDESEQLNQMQPDETLIDRGVDDVLDEGYVTPEHWSPGQGFGSTASEMHQGETLAMRIAQEEPERVADDSPWNPDPAELRQVGHRRAGRLVDAGGGFDAEDVESESIAHDVGIDGAAASAEEAAMHIIDDFDNELD